VVKRVTPLLAVCLGREFDTQELAKQLPGRHVFARWEEPVEVEVHGVRVFIYAFGTVVFFSKRSKTIESFIEWLKRFIIGHKTEYWEEYALIYSRKRPEDYIGRVEIDGTKLYVAEEGIYSSVDIPKKVLKIITFVLAQSAALSRMEAYADDIAERMDDVLEALREKGVTRFLSLKRIHRTLIDALRARNALINDLLILEPPDLAMESEEHERLFKILRSVFDVDERSNATEKKLDTVADSANVVSDILLQDVFLALEVLIVLFFFIEVVALLAGLW